MFAPRVPQWQPDNCIQCNQCVQSCPHAAIRAKQIKPEDLAGAPDTFTTVKYKASKTMDLQYKVQVYTDDCQGCGVCIETCPAKDKALVFSTLEKERALGEHENEKFFEPLPYGALDGSSEENMKGMQFQKTSFRGSPVHVPVVVKLPM